MRWWRTREKDAQRSKSPAPDLGTPGLVSPNCELPQSYLECPGGRCEGERLAARADHTDMCESYLPSRGAKLPQLRRAASRSEWARARTEENSGATSPPATAPTTIPLRESGKALRR